MPTFKRQLQQPLTPEGEYTGIIIGAGQETNNDIIRFRLPIRLPDGKIITTTVPFLDAYPDLVQKFVQSAGLQLPDNGDPQISCDDIERLQVWFAVKHKEGKDGRTYANVLFHPKSYAIRQNPSLAAVKFPQARKPGKLRGVTPLDGDNGSGGSDHDHFDEDDQPMAGNPQAEQLRNLLEEKGARQPDNIPF
jgi:hypothetical protein